MTIRTRVWQALLTLFSIVLIVSLVMNYMHYKKTKREEQYVRLMYNQFMFDVSMAGDYLGAVNSHVDYKRAAINTADAANVLNALENYEMIVDSNNSTTTSTPHIRDIADFLSYVSLAFVNENAQYRTSNGLVTITQPSAKSIMLKLNNILKSNMQDSNIPPDKVATVFNQINSLIPNDIRTQTSVLDFFNH